MPISDRLSAFLADPSQVLTRKRDILYLFGVGVTEEDDAILEDQDDKESTEQPSKADDLSALLILERLVPSTAHDAIASAGPDQVWLSTEIKNLRGKATVQDVLNLRRLGVFEEDDSLSMFA